MVRKPFNNSKAKQLFSFSRTERFPKTPDKYFGHIPWLFIVCSFLYWSCSQVSYTSNINPPGKTRGRTCGIGFGQKYDIIKVAQTKVGIPSPQTYNIRYNFVNKKKGMSFGVSRAVTSSSSSEQSQTNLLSFCFYKKTIILFFLHGRYCLLQLYFLWIRPKNPSFLFSTS